MFAPESEEAKLFATSFPTYVYPRLLLPCSLSLSCQDFQINHRPVCPCSCLVQDPAVFVVVVASAVDLTEQDM
jgi:hypothetical protein